jgi:hypothetical protein
MRGEGTFTPGAVTNVNLYGANPLCAPSPPTPWAWDQPTGGSTPPGNPWALARGAPRCSMQRPRSHSGIAGSIG